ncbi:hypothetical protein HN832_01030 [archaeon]|jgi:hypothetical protein|nr:hypothetical protein [archaeon]MBT4373795.1 hypothetical protein [archaeon]MBT4532261.1 hypothetical protein [archaeon]MBT7001086.1 hypothetical protein [archaeon]MBT7281975.1 hypothetical protein [archaeon]
MRNKNFPLAKILNVTATEYLASVGKELSDYELRGVHLETGELYKKDDPDSFVEAFAEVVPRNTEVVVNYQMNVGTSQSSSFWFGRHQFVSYNGIGIALVPKEI